MTTKELIDLLTKRADGDAEVFANGVSIAGIECVTRYLSDGSELEIVELVTDEDCDEGDVD
mgnify:CR=1 FL=1